jgi:hypothetical protein
MPMKTNNENLNTITIQNKPRNHDLSGYDRYNYDD